MVNCFSVAPFKNFLLFWLSTVCLFYICVWISLLLNFFGVIFKNQIWGVVCHYLSFPALSLFVQLQGFPNIYVSVPDVVLKVSEVLFTLFFPFLFFRLCIAVDLYSGSLIWFSFAISILLFRTSRKRLILDLNFSH